MKTIISLFVAGVILAMPLSVNAGPDESQRMMTQRIMEAKKQLAAAEAAKGAERQKMMQDHMKMMQIVLAQMEKAKPAAALTPEQMREWIDEHLKLMNDLMGQMMSEHHLMMQSTGK